MTDSEPTNVIRMKRPSSEALEVLSEQKKKRTKKEPEETKNVPAFAKPPEALAAVLKAHTALDRAEAKKAKLGKELGDELKSRNTALASAVENLEGKSQLHELTKGYFAAIDAAKEKASAARSTIKAKREAITKALEEVSPGSASDLKKLNAAWKAVEKAKEEAANARAAAKATYSTAAERFRDVVAGARQLSLDV